MLFAPLYIKHKSVKLDIELEPCKNPGSSCRIVFGLEISKMQCIYVTFCVFFCHGVKAHFMGIQIPNDVCIPKCNASNRKSHLTLILKT